MDGIPYSSLPKYKYKLTEYCGVARLIIGAIKAGLKLYVVVNVRTYILSPY